MTIFGQCYNVLNNNSGYPFIHFSHPLHTKFNCILTGDNFRNIMFKEPKQNKALTRHVIRSEQVPDEGSCRVLCYMEPNCVSINVGPLEGGKHQCELNNVTDENQFTHFLENRNTFTYLAIDVSFNFFMWLSNCRFSLSRHQNKNRKPFNE